MCVGAYSVKCCDARTYQGKRVYLVFLFSPAFNFNGANYIAGVLPVLDEWKVQILNRPPGRCHESEPPVMNNRWRKWHGVEHQSFSEHGSMAGYTIANDEWKCAGIGLQVLYT